MMRRPFMNIEFRYTFNITGLVDSTGDYVDVMEGYQKEQQQNVQSIFSMATTPPPSTTAVYGNHNSYYRTMAKYILFIDQDHLIRSVGMCTVNSKYHH